MSYQAKLYWNENILYIIYGILYILLIEYIWIDEFIIFPTSSLTYLLDNYYLIVNFSFFEVIWIIM